MNELYQEKYAEKPEEYVKITPGVGTDVFIRKKAPGSQVGEGYSVDIYENGVKVDTLIVDTKKEILALIREFKEKYNTDRAFQNELQVHITYKTKEERGELAMTSLDKQLLKKASTIQNILTRLLQPHLPLVHRADNGGELGGVESVPTAPGTGIDKEQVKKFMVDEIISKYTQFVNNKVMETEPQQEELRAASQRPKHGIAIDNIYNSLRKWYSKLLDNILQFNKENKNAFTEDDIRQVVDETTRILTSRDPNLISQAAGIDVSQEVADIMADVGTKSVGRPGEAEEGGELGGNPETAQTKEEVQASDKTERRVKADIETELFEFEKRVESFGSTTPIPELAKESGMDDSEKIIKVYDILEKKGDLNEAQTAIKIWAEEELREREETAADVEQFWKFAGGVEGVNTVDDLFIDWLAEKGSQNIDRVARVWSGICSDIEQVFGREKIEVPDVVDKMAQYEDWGIARISVTTAGEAGMDIIMDGYIEYSPHTMRLDYVPITDKAQQMSYSLISDILRGIGTVDANTVSQMAGEVLQTLKADPSIIGEYLKTAYGPDITGSVNVTTELKQKPGRFEMGTKENYKLERNPGEPDFRVA